jgi:hypothetical protein
MIIMLTRFSWTSSPTSGWLIIDGDKKFTGELPP